MRPWLVSLVALVMSGSVAWAGPVILGGDDLTDHGSRTPAGVNLEGWLYIEKAIGNLNAAETRPGAHTSTIAALGSAADPSFTAFDAGGAIGSAAQALGLTVEYFDGATAINQFFTDLGGGTKNPAIIWLAGTGASNDLDATEGTALTGNAAAINSFVASGGGLMAHGSGPTAYGWLSALLPAISEVDGCESTGATLTAAGSAAFPGLSNSNVDDNAGPCHSHFEGNFGGLQALVMDGSDPSVPYIIGGGGGTLIVCGEPGQEPCPPPINGVPEPATLTLLAAGALGVGARAWRSHHRRQ